jgi:CO/xanthine dehydrogenase FAD-binding subunit
MSVAAIEAFLRPGTLDEALEALGDGAVAVAGGVDVMLHGPPEARVLVDLTGLPLSYIRERDGFAVGATTTLTEMLEHPGLREHLDGVVAGMLRHVGSPLLRNVATIGGHLARTRISDVVPLFVALDATITVYDGADRPMLLSDFYAHRVHDEPMLITEVAIPEAGDDTAAAFLKFSRTFFDIALLNCACSVRLGDDGNVSAGHVVVGETPAIGATVAPAEEALIGGSLEDEAIDRVAAVAAEAIPAATDSRAGADYRRALCRAGVARCLREVRGRFRERGR